MVAHVLKPADESAAESGTVDRVEVMGAKVAVFDVVPQDVAESRRRGALVGREPCPR